MKYYISKRVISGNFLLLVALALLMFGVLPVDTGQTAQASTANVPVDNVTGIIQPAALSYGDTEAGSGSPPPLARVQAVAFSCSSVSEIPTAECEALVALFNATDGPNWANNSGWLVTDTPCSWHGVTCNAAHVTAHLDLRFNQLGGSIPAELGNLSNLTRLNLPSNQLSGSIPVEMGNLSNLIQLGLGFNLLSGSIPVELGNLSNLTFLILRSNQLSGSLPAELGNLSNLSQLLLNNNRLSGSLPQNLTNLNLTSFWFQNTSLCEPPDAAFQTWLSSIGNLQSTGVICSVAPVFSCSSVSEIPTLECEALVALFNATDGLNWNNNTDWLVTDTPCSWLGVTCGSTHVTQLDLSRNQLSGSIPVELANLSNLTLLALQVNQLSGGIPVELANLSNLTSLFLVVNQLSGSIPAELGNLSNLTNLDLSRNQLSGSIPVELANLSNLTLLALQVNQLSGSIPVELGNLSNLTSLSLEGNQLSGSIPAELGNLSNLIVLNLSRNQLSGGIPVELANLTNLAFLGLGENQLSGSIPVELGNLSNLNVLLLNSNQLSGSIPVELGNLSNLIQLFLNSNQLSGPLPQNLTNLNLTFFHFQNTALCEPPDAGFQAWLSNIGNLQSTGVICTVTARQSPRSLILSAFDNISMHTAEDEGFVIASSFIQNSLDPDLWVDDFHIAHLDVFEWDRDAVRELMGILRFRPNLSPEAVMWTNMAIDEIEEASRALADILIQETIAAPTLDPDLQTQIDDLLNAASSHLADGEASMAAGDTIDALISYVLAWEKADKAMALKGQQPAQVINDPQIISTPVTSATEGQLYTYDVDVFEPDGTRVVHFLTHSPEGMTMDIDTGIITWIPTGSQVGTHFVEVLVGGDREEDGRAFQSFNIEVTGVADNIDPPGPPVVTSIESIENAIIIRGDVDPDVVEVIATCDENCRVVSSTVGSFEVVVEPTDPDNPTSNIVEVQLVAKDQAGKFSTDAPGVDPVPVNALFISQIASCQGQTTRGDINLSGAFDMADLTTLVDIILGRLAAPLSGSPAFIQGDVNGDNALNTADLNLFVDCLLGRIVRFPVEGLGIVQSIGFQDAITFYDMTSGNLLSSLNGRGGGFGASNGIAITSDGTRAIVTGQQDLFGLSQDTVQIFDLTVTPPQLIQGHSLLSTPQDVDVTPDGKLGIVQSIGFQDAITFYDMTSGNLLSSLNGRGGGFGASNGIAITSDGTRAIVTGQVDLFGLSQDTVQIFDLTVAPPQLVQGHSLLSTPQDVDVTPDGNLGIVQSIGIEGAITFYDMSNGNLLSSLNGRGGGFGASNGIAITSDGTRAIVTGQVDLIGLSQDTVQIFDLTVAPPQLIQGHSILSTPQDVDVTPDGNLGIVQSIGIEGAITFYDMSNGNLLSSLDGRGGGFGASNGIAITSDGTRAIVTGQQDLFGLSQDTVQIFDLTVAPPQLVQGHSLLSTPQDVDVP